MACQRLPASVDHDCGTVPRPEGRPASGGSRRPPQSTLAWTWRVKHVAAVDSSAACSRRCVRRPSRQRCREPPHVTERVHDAARRSWASTEVESRQAGAVLRARRCRAAPAAAGRRGRGRSRRGRRAPARSVRGRSRSAPRFRAARATGLRRRWLARGCDWTWGS